MVARLNALGNLDAIVSVYRAARSRLIPAGCAATDDNGRGAPSFRSEGGDYLVMVGRERDSDDGKFKLTTFRQEPSSKLPAPALPGGGVSSWVEPIDFDVAFSLRMKTGVEYRVNLSPARGRCVSLTLFAPGIRSLAGAAPIRSVPCGGYLTYTPGLGGGGRYTLLVTATDERPGRSATTSRPRSPGLTTLPRVSRCRTCRRGAEPCPGRTSTSLTYTASRSPNAAT